MIGKPLIYGSVCSGIEAATAAWHPLGWKAAFFSEIEPFPRAVLKHHYSDVPLHGDFTTIQKGNYEPIQLLVGGTPCQSFSIAGLRGGMDDHRGNLALEFCKLVDRLRPAWVVWENVPGVLSSNGGRDFGSILGALAELGYGWAYRILDAQYFGVPQRRRRVFVVGYFRDLGTRTDAQKIQDTRRFSLLSAAVLFERHSMSGHPAPCRATRKENSDGVRDGVAGSIAAHHTGGWPGTGTDIAGAFIPEVSHTLGDTTKSGANDMNRLGALIAHGVDGLDVGYSLRSNPSHSGDKGDGGLNTTLVTSSLRRGNSPDENDAEQNRLVVSSVTSKWAKGSGDPAGDECQNLIAIHSHVVGRGPKAGPQGKEWLNDGSAYTHDASGESQIIAFGSKEYAQDATRNIAPPLRAMGSRKEHPNGGGQVAIAYTIQSNDGGAHKRKDRPNGGGQVAIAIRTAQTSSNGWGIGTDEKAYTLDGASGQAVVTFDETASEPLRMQGFRHASEAQANTGKILQFLREEIGEEAFAQWGLGILDSLQSAQILQSDLHGEGLRSSAQAKSQMDGGSSRIQTIDSTGAMLTLREAGRKRRSPQGCEFSKQFEGELGAYLSLLSHEGAPQGVALRSLWEASEGIGILRQALSEIQEIWQSAPLEKESTHPHSSVRRLTPRECERLMGFPDDYTLIPVRGKPAADGPRYKAIGNSMAVPVMRWIGERIQMVEDILEERTHG